MKNLTKQETQIINLLTEGFTNKEIAEKMSLSYHTIKAHLESIYNKLSVSNRVQAVVSFIQSK